MNNMQESSNNILLAIDTSGPSLSVALEQNGLLLGEVLLNVSSKHSVHFMPSLDSLMRQTRTAPDQLAAIAVTRGPGSFTGIRIGVTTANTMAYGLNIPVIGVSSLAALAEPHALFDGWVLPAFDARGGRVFAAVFASGCRLTEDAQYVDDGLSETINYLLVKQASELPKRILVLGSGAETVLKLLADTQAELIRPADRSEHSTIAGAGSVDLIRASAVAALARRQPGLSDGIFGEAVRPDYCVVSQAERLRQQRQAP